MPAKLHRLVYRQLRTTYDLKPSLLGSLVLPSFLYVLVAAVAYSSIIAPFQFGNRTIDYAAFLIPGVILMEVASMSILGGAMFWTDKYNGMLERLLAMPFPRSYYFVSRVLALLAASASIAAALLLVGLPFMLSSIALNLRAAMLCLTTIVLVCLLFSSLSLLASPFLKTPDSVTVFSRLVSTPIVLLSSVFYPLDNAPELIRAIARYNPLSFAADILRASLYDLPQNGLEFELVGLLAFTLGIFGLTIYVFSRRDLTTN